MNMVVIEAHKICFLYQKRWSARMLLTSLSGPSLQDNPGASKGDQAAKVSVGSQEML